MEERKGWHEELRSKSAMKGNPLQKIRGDFAKRERLAKTLSSRLFVCVSLPPHPFAPICYLQSI